LIHVLVEFVEDKVPDARVASQSTERFSHQHCVVVISCHSHEASLLCDVYTVLDEPNEEFVESAVAELVNQ
jgi:hypothetical protein